jgi:fermentation-respiration switch protein FrsA (DUF1100 family)
LSKSWALSLALAASLLSGCGWLNRSLMYHPGGEVAVTPERLKLPYEELWLRASDGPQLHAWLIPNASTSPVVLLCHGNAGNISNRLLKANLLRKAGASVLLFDYRGFGRSGGTPTEDGTYEDAEAAYGWLRAHGVPESAIVLYGESLGSGVAVELATRHDAAGVIVEAGFTSALDMGKRLFPHLPISWLLRYRYDNLAKMPRLRSPVLILHSPDDEIVPFAMGQRLFAAALPPKSFAPLRGDHNGGFLTSAQEYVDAVRIFLGTPRPPGH